MIACFYHQLCNVTKFGIEKAKQLLNKLKLTNNPLSIHKYLDSRLHNNDIISIWNDVENEQHNEICKYLQESQATSIFAKRSFSMLNNLIAQKEILKLEMGSTIWN